MKYKLKRVIGREEIVDLQELGLNNIVGKIDTGAYTSSLHCSKIAIEKNFVKFLTLNNREFTFPIEKIKNVKSSSGESERRVFIKTTVKVFNKSYKIELSLTDRSFMKRDLLIGRKFLRNRFIVDVALKNVGKEKGNEVSNTIEK